MAGSFGSRKIEVPDLLIERSAVMATDAPGEAPSGQYYWPNKMGRMYLLALEDVMGKNGANAVLNQARLRHRINNYPPCNLDLGWSFQEMSDLSQALVDLHGPEGGSALALRVGHAWFHYAMKDMAAVLGIADLAFRLLPLSTKIRLGLQAMADTFNNTSDQIVHLEEEGDRFLYHVERCPFCWNRVSDVAICHSGLGILQAGVHWVTGGKEVRIGEIGCLARGEPFCTYRIEKRPHA